MDATDLLEPVLGNGIRLTNFFNGRILTAEDLRTDQQGNRAQHRQLARAVGEGVVHGLEVAASAPAGGAPALTILPGLAFNRDGDAVALGRATQLRLVTAREAANAEAGLFAVCQARSDPLELTNVGLYVLTACPASGLSSERAPMAEFGSEGVAGSCASRWAVEGVRFSVAPLPLATPGEAPSALAADMAALVEEVDEDVALALRGGASDTPQLRARLQARLSRLRSGTAYLCFGAEELARRAAAAFAGTAVQAGPYGAVDGMRERGELAGCEVPLALLYLSARGLEWVDAWAVRRPPVPALHPGAPHPGPLSRRAAEGAAMVLQFQAHAADLLKPGQATAAAAVRAADFFRFLPPAALLPVRGGAAPAGFDRSAFFFGRTVNGPTFLEGARLGPIVRDAMGYPPIDLGGREMSWLYSVRENAQAAGAQPYLLFTNGHVPYRGFAQMDLARWDFANYA